MVNRWRKIIWVGSMIMSANKEKQNLVLDCTCGIYSTDYRLTCHRDGTVTVRVPTIKWRNNTGTLAHTLEHVSLQQDVLRIKAMFAANDGLCDQHCITIDDLIYGRITWTQNARSQS